MNTLLSWFTKCRFKVYFRDEKQVLNSVVFDRYGNMDHLIPEIQRRGIQFVGGAASNRYPNAKCVWIPPSAICMIIELKD